MSKLIVDGVEVDVPPEYTLLQACEEAGAEIPRFCYHERLSIAGNCRMCLVEVKGGPPKPSASCAMAVRDLRPGPNGEPPVVLTNSPMVKKAREGVMEFLLINHPLDCPICDQGGECDLQDQAMAFGFDSSRYAENKRAVEDKYIGPLVRTSMNRCIHCTRCVRFTAEVAGTGDMGAIGRGEDMEITTYLETAMASELQGNVADLCPVGALLPKPYSFKARSWELVKTESIDVMDALGSAIRIDTRGREVMRILPRINDAVNEEWISDKARQIVDGLEDRAPRQALCARRRQTAPGDMARSLRAHRGEDQSDDCRAHRRHCRRSCRRRGDVRAANAVDESLGAASLDCRQDGAKLDPQFGRASYLFNPTIAGIDEADAPHDHRLKSAQRGAGAQRPHPQALAERRLSRSASSAKRRTSPTTMPISAPAPTRSRRFAEHPPARMEQPLFLVGQGALARPDGLAILSLAAKAAASLGVVKDGWNGFAILHTAAARVGGLDLGFVPGAGGLDAAGMAQPGALDVIFNLGADEIDIAPGAFVIYQGSHGDRGAAPRRRHPAGRRLHREIRPLCQHRRARAARRPRQFPAGRRARGLGDHPRALRRSRPSPAVRFACASLARKTLSPRIPISRRSMQSRLARLLTPRGSSQLAARGRAPPSPRPSSIFILPTRSRAHRR